MSSKIVDKRVLFSFGSATRVSISLSLLLIEVVNHARDVDRTVLRIITVAGTPNSTPAAAIGFSLYDCRRPEDLDIAVRTAQRLLNPTRILTIVSLEWITLYVHVLLPQTHCWYLPVQLLHTSMPQRVLEPRKKSVRKVLESERLFSSYENSD